MAVLSQVRYPGAVLLTVETGAPRPLRVLFGAPPEVSRRLKADQQKGPDGKPVMNFPDVVVCPGVRVVHDTPTLCPEFILFASAFLGGRYNWAEARMNDPIRWIGTPDELDDLQTVMKECFLGVDDRELRNRVRSNRGVREMLLNDQKFFALQDKAGNPHPLSHYCTMLPYDGERRVMLAEGLLIEDHPAEHVWIVEYKGQRETVALDYTGVEVPMWGATYPVPDAPLRPHLFGLTVLGSDSAFSTTGPTTTNLLSLGGEFFLWDCSPFTAWLLQRLGISIGDIRGIFVSHIHDDHVVDLYKFAWNGYRRIELITTAEVREQVLRKFGALWGVSRDDVEAAFIWRIVVPGKAFLINGVSINVHYGAHPIPSFGGRFEYGEHAFGVTGDTSSRGGPVGLDKQLEKGLISAERHDFLVGFPARQFTLCDAGEATIHGFVKDFEAFDPACIALAHRSDIPPPFNEKMKLAGPLFDRKLIESNQTVMDATVVTEVITGLGSRLTHWVNRFLQSQAPRNLKPGDVIIRQGDRQPDFVYLTLAGTGEVLVDDQRVALLERGSFFGEQSFLRNAPRNATVRAVSAMRVLPVPGNLFLDFIAEDAEDSARARRGSHTVESVRDRLEKVWAHRHLINEVFGGRLSQNSVHSLAAQALVLEVEKDAPVQMNDVQHDDVLVVAKGSVEVLGAPGLMLTAGDVVGEVAPCGTRHRRVIPAVARERSTLVRLPGQEFEQLLVNTPGLRKHVEDCLARNGRRLRLPAAQRQYVQ